MTRPALGAPPAARHAERARPSLPELLPAGEARRHSGERRREGDPSPEQQQSGDDQPEDAAARAHRARHGGRVQARERLDRGQEKDQQNQADDEVHQTNAFTSGRNRLRREWRAKAEIPGALKGYAEIHDPRICDSSSRAVASDSASSASAFCPPAA